MEGRGDLQQDGPLGAAFLGQHDRPLDRRSRAGDDGLFGSVQVGRLDRRAHLPRCILAYGDDRLRVHAKNRGHRPLARGHGLLHQLPAAAHGASRGGELDGPGGNVGGVLAQRMSGKIIRGRPSRGQNPERRHGDGKDRRLGELSQAKLLFGSVEAELRQVEAKCLIGFLKGLARDGKAEARSRPMPTLCEP